MDTQAPYGKGALFIFNFSGFMKKGNKKDAPGVLKHLFMFLSNGVMSVFNLRVYFSE